MLDIEENLYNIQQYRPNWTDEDKTAYVNKLKYINENYDKLLAIHHALISNSLRTFDYLTDANAEFLLSYLRGKENDSEIKENDSESKEDLREIKNTLKKMQEDIKRIEDNIAIHK